LTVSESLYTQLLYLAAGAFLLTAVLILWRRELAVIVRILALQGLALAAMVAVLAAHEGSAQLWAVAGGIAVLRVVVLPHLVRRALTGAEAARRDTAPSVNVTSSLLAAAGLTLLGYAVSQPLVALAPSPATQAIPVGVTVVLIGFLTTAGVELVVEVGVSLDVLLAVLVLGLLATRMRDTFGDTDLDELRELRD